MFLFAPIGSILALVFAAGLIFYISKQPKGSQSMIDISNSVKEGANAYLKRQYGVVSIFFAVTFGVLLWLAKNNT